MKSDTNTINSSDAELTTDGVDDNNPQISQQLRNSVLRYRVEVQIDVNSNNHIISVL